MKFKVGDIVKVLDAPPRCVTNWPGMVGRVGFIEELHFNGTRALVRTITINGEMHRLAFIWVKALTHVHDPTWAHAIAKYKQEGAKMSKPQDKPINPFEAARQSSGIQVKIDVHDVLAIHPDCDEAWARTFLAIYSEPLARVMLLAGTAMIRDLLEQPNGN
jgi:hypothetical protein